MNTSSFSHQQITQFKEICSPFGITLTYEMIEKFQAYTELLLEWNKRIHLVSKKDARADRIMRHFIDSLTIFKAVNIPENSNLLDIGSGAGFPAIPIKIVREDVQLTLVESVHKKTLFLHKLIEVLKLEKTIIVNQRAEELVNQDAYKQTYDLVTAKALGKLKNTAHLSSYFLRFGGLMVAYKGKDVKKEIDEFELSKNYKIRDTVKIEFPEIDLSRWLVIVESVVRS